MWKIASICCLKKCLFLWISLLFYISKKCTRETANEKKNKESKHGYWISNSYLIRYKFQGYRCKSGIAIFAWGVTWKYAYSVLNVISMTTWLGLGVTATLLDTLLVCQDPLAEMEGITTVMLTTLEVNGNFSTYHLTFWLFDNFMFHPVRIRKVWNVSDMPMSNIKSPELFTRHLRHPNFCQFKCFLGEDDL